jgi:hypothetical protein
MALTSSIAASLRGTFVKTVGGLVGDLAMPVDGSFAASLSSGTGNSQADLIYQAQRTLSSEATEDLDLAGTLTDPFGATITFVKVKAIYIRAAAGNTNSVVVGGASSNAFLGPFADATDKVSIPPSGAFLAAAPVAGWAVTASTGDLLTVTNSGSGTSVTYDIVIVGTSA